MRVGPRERREKEPVMRSSGRQRFKPSCLAQAPAPSATNTLYSVYHQLDSTLQSYQRSPNIGETLPKGRQPSELFCSSLNARDIGFGTPERETVEK